MATAVLVSAFEDQLKDLGGPELEDITSAQVVRFLNRAILNNHQTLGQLCPSTYKGTSTLTFAAEAGEIALPTDWDQQTHVSVYNDAKFRTPFARDYSYVEDGVLRFNTDQVAGTKVYVRYRKEPNRYSTTNETLAESENIRALEFLQDEVIALYLQSEEDLEQSGAAANVLNNKNRIS
tara:strand:+ start:566 stop:1102 length:537 start_codon:yes stop_codon:yes gene_type:complete